MLVFKLWTSFPQLIWFISTNQIIEEKNIKKLKKKNMLNIAIAILKPETLQAETNRFVIDSIFFCERFLFVVHAIDVKVNNNRQQRKTRYAIIKRRFNLFFSPRKCRECFFLSFSVFKKINWIICLVLISMCFVHSARIEMKGKVNSKQKQICFLVDRKETKRLVSGLLHCSISVLVVRWCMPITNVRQLCSTF